jgi:IMP dehydrogenase/GMP reductase
LSVKVPITSALMLAVSNEDLAIALASSGGLSFIHGSCSSHPPVFTKEANTMLFLETSSRRIEVNRVFYEPS